MNKYDKFYNKNENKAKLTFDELLMEIMMNKIKVNDKNYKAYGKNYIYIRFLTYLNMIIKLKAI